MSLVDDLLVGLSALSDSAVAAVAVPAYAVADIPFFIGELIPDAVGAPTLISSLASFAVQRCLNPMRSWSWPSGFSSTSSKRWWDCCRRW